MSASTSSGLQYVARSPFAILVMDPSIALSWIVFAIGGLLGIGGVRDTAEALTTFVATGYVVWSLYFGLAAFWRFVLARFTALPAMWRSVGCVSIVFFGWVSLLIASVLSVLGLGLAEFLVGWYLLAHGHRPPFVAVAGKHP